MQPRITPKTIFLKMSYFYLTSSPERRIYLSYVSKFLEEINKIHKEIAESKEIKPDDEAEVYSEETFTGLSLIERESKLVLVIFALNTPGDNVYEIEWPGTREDFEDLKKEFEYLPYQIPYIIVWVIRLLAKGEKRGSKTRS